MKHTALLSDFRSVSSWNSTFLKPRLRVLVLPAAAAGLVSESDEEDVDVNELAAGTAISNECESLLPLILAAYWAGSSQCTIDACRRMEAKSILSLIFILGAVVGGFMISFSHKFVVVVSMSD